MFPGGAPGVLIGSLLLQHLLSAGSQNLLNAILGAILMTTAAGQILRSFRLMTHDSTRPDRGFLLPWLMFPVGAEVGFSSAGAARWAAPHC